MQEEWCLATILTWLPASQCHGAVAVSCLWRQHVCLRFHGTTLRETRARAVLSSVSCVPGGYLGGSVALRAYLAHNHLPCAWKCGPPNVYVVEQRDVSHFAQSVRAIAGSLQDALGCPVEGVIPARGRTDAVGWCGALERALWELEDPVAVEHGLFNPTWMVKLQVAGLDLVVEGTRFSLQTLRDNFDLSVCRVMARATEDGAPQFHVSPDVAHDIASRVMRGGDSADVARVRKYALRGFIPCM